MRFLRRHLDGISAKLDYLAEIGVTHIYLNPIFEAQANHRYNTGDYHRVDEMLGGEEALKRLIAEAKKRGIRLMLDGVFSHTGAESAYFNKTGRYPGLGAYQAKVPPTIAGTALSIFLTSMLADGI